MADEKHMYAVFGGSWEDPEDQPEIWQFGVRLALVFGTIDPLGTLPNNWDVIPRADTDTSGDWDVTTLWSVDGPGIESFDAQSYMEDFLIPSFEAYLGTDAFSLQAKADFIKLSPIGPDGLVIDQRTCLAATNTDVHGSLGGSILPLQNSICVSTRTPVIGRKGRGRFYLPSPAVSLVDSKGRLASGVAAAFAGLASDFIEGLTYSGPTSGDAHVHAIVTGSPWTHYGLIDSVRVDDVVDTQRRRRNQLDGTYSSSPVSA